MRVRQTLTLLLVVLAACGQPEPEPVDGVHQQRITAEDVFGSEPVPSPANGAELAGDPGRDPGRDPVDPQVGPEPVGPTSATRSWALVHVFVALCDPGHQGVGRAMELH